VVTFAAEPVIEADSIHAAIKQAQDLGAVDIRSITRLA
jgi:hypothetical protein